MRLQSYAIESAAYDENSHLLRVRFRHSGQIVVYENVPRELYDSLIFAASINGFFREHIEGPFPRRKH